VRTWRASAALAVLMLLATGCENANDSTPETDRHAPAASLSCQESIESLDGATTAGAHTVVLGRVALPTGTALGVNRTAEDPEFPLFAKDGLVIRAGASFELVVPGALRGRLRIGWGSAARPTTRLAVSDCRATDPSKPWLAYAGGYFVSEPACVALIVRATNESQRVRIGVGAPCPGQDPPPAPVNP
jgi:hypothetical protein